ncbi:MAG: NAD(P)/FAD-dependent oxidoreductase [Epulopiscium sp.]|nr:NAD(P)/FAD-dependent oxidoreductase [Candidatus Epulonipiscium sp.]
MKTVDLIIIGGGPAGMSAAVSAHHHGIKDILILDRDSTFGGILGQCIHNGFGLHRFKEELTGPEYAWKYEKQVLDLGIPFKLNTMVVDVTESKVVTAVNEADGIFQIQAKAIILAMGCRERSLGALNISGTRPAGIYTAGTAQYYVNIKGYMPGRKVVILGSGDIGLIMARRMTLEGAKVEMVCELMPYSSGLTRNIVQCLNDFNIPLMLNHTIVKIHGKERVTGITIAKVDENKKPIVETAQFVECDTILLSVGLIPENELTIGASIQLDPVTGGAVVNQNCETSQSGIFACGNVLHVHDLVDYVSEESELAGKSAANYILAGKKKEIRHINLKLGNGVRYTVPQQITAEEEVTLYFRVADVYKNVIITIKDGNEVIYKRKKQKVIPAEMEMIKLTTEMIKNIKNNIITLGVEGR